MQEADDLSEEISRDWHTRKGNIGVERDALVNTPYIAKVDGQGRINQRSKKVKEDVAGMDTSTSRAPMV